MICEEIAVWACHLTILYVCVLLDSLDIIQRLDDKIMFVGLRFASNTLCSDCSAKYFCPNFVF